MPQMGKLMIIIGLLIAVVGALLIWGENWGIKLFQLPGDIRIERGNTRIFIPITSMILLNVILFGVMWLLKRK
jgi:hypothetical protein